MALWTAGTAQWVADGVYAHREIVAPTGPNGTAAWACAVGSADEHGSFENFTTRVLLAGELRVADPDTMETTLGWSDSGLRIEFGWEAPLNVTQPGGGPSVTVALAGYPRFANPFVQASFPARGALTIAHAGIELELDYDAATRVTRTAPTAPPTPAPAPSPSASPAAPAPTAPAARPSAAPTPAPSEALSQTTLAARTVPEPEPDPDGGEADASRGGGSIELALRRGDVAAWAGLAVGIALSVAAATVAARWRWRRRRAARNVSFKYGSVPLIENSAYTDGDQSWRNAEEIWA